ncbi:hypothetical protein CC86DRAFT_406049 [Ophiobolus disseminans]|uniref:Uncharacterized protein n=1 Tax=Ophiobolus disseminans TaxID=1469910 RepID=A0A6A7A120_9PLEO|nr:hypothetical protein CC86DRAFT_406049 [Ophiobolus disseminans]
MSFLNLPREFRNVIYAHAAAPATSLSNYKGLRLSCKQVRAEYTHECCRNLQLYLQSLRELMPGICVEIPEASQYTGRCNLRLSLSTKVFAGYGALTDDSPMPVELSILQSILDGNFDSVTMDFYEESGTSYSDCDPK